MRKKLSLKTSSIICPVFYDDELSNPPSLMDLFVFVFLWSNAKRHLLNLGLQFGLNIALLVKMKDLLWFSLERYLDLPLLMRPLLVYTNLSSLQAKLQ